jgi:hypothetical protein
MTCGAPICRFDPDAGGDGGLTDDAGAPCPALGTACTTDGATCGDRNTPNACGAVEQCAATNPQLQGCPISSRAFKDDVRYLDEAQLDQLHEEAIHIRLATYNYKAQLDDPTRRHLGFIIEDDPQSPAVDRPYDRVDLYGYLSMAVATMQVQEKEIDALKQEVRELRGERCGGEGLISR